MKNQKHPDWLTVPVSCVISEWLRHLQWTWTSYWWVLNGNVFERLSLEILETHKHKLPHTHKHIHSDFQRRRESKFITVNDGQVDAETFWSDRMDQVSAADPFWLFCISFCLPELRCSLGNHNISIVGIFIQRLSDCLTGQINKSNGWNN